MTRVLVVEDSATQANQLELILGGEGFAVETARDGRTGLERATTAPFDLVLSDILMPGLSGYELCRRLKQQAATAHLPVILLTTLNDPMDVIEGLACGAENFVTKPFEPAFLVGRIRNLLANKHMRAGSKLTAGVEIVFMGRRFTVTSGKEQILDLLISTFEDVVRTNRELRASQSALAEAERQQRLHAERLARVNKELEAFVYTVSHDLKEPLRGIQAFSGFLQDEHAGGLDDQGRHYLDLVRDGATRMQQLIDDLLAFARVGRQAGATARVPLVAVVRDALGLLDGARAEAAAEIAVAPDLPTVEGHTVLLAQLFANLLGNAFKFRHADRSCRVAVSWEVAGAGAAVRIADNGIGVPPEHRERVFGLFQRLHRREQYPGTGVGLALCKRIIEEHGGTIALEDTPGGGCTVALTFPQRLEAEP